MVSSINNYEVHEDNVVFEACYLLRNLGYKTHIKPYMGKIQGSAAYCDLAIYTQEDEIIGIVEFKNRKNYPYQGECNCSIPPTPQLMKYCHLDIPLYICNGYEGVDNLILWVITQSNH